MRGRRKIQLDDSQIAEVIERHNRHESTRKIAAAMDISQWVVWVTLNDLKPAPEPTSQEPVNSQTQTQMEAQTDGEAASEIVDDSPAKSELRMEMEACLGLRDLAEVYAETDPELSRSFMEQFRREHRRIAYKLRWGGRTPSFIELVARVEREKRSEQPKSDVSSLLQEKRQEFYKLMDQYNAQLVAEAKALTYEYMKARIAKKQTGPSEAWKIEQRGTVAVKLIEMDISAANAGIWMMLAEPFIQKGLSGLKALKAAIRKQKKTRRST